MGPGVHTSQSWGDGQNSRRQSLEDPLARLTRPRTAICLANMAPSRQRNSSGNSADDGVGEKRKLWTAMSEVVQSSFLVSLLAPKEVGCVPHRITDPACLDQCNVVPEMFRVGWPGFLSGRLETKDGDACLPSAAHQTQTSVPAVVPPRPRRDLYIVMVVRGTATHAARGFENATYTRTGKVSPNDWATLSVWEGLPSIERP